MTILKSLKPSVVLTFGVVIWVGLIVFLLLQLITDRMVPFDEDQIVFNRFESVEGYLNSIDDALNSASKDQISVVRIIDEDCSCNFASSLHWAQIQDQYSDISYTELALGSLSSQMQELIPATPMAIVYDTEGKALYAGPFSNSNYCNSENSFIEAYLNGSLTQRYSPLQTQGCYCKNKP